MTDRTDAEIKEAAPDTLKKGLFPIQGGHPRVPWNAAEIAYKSYSRQFGTRQSLERLAARGGFGLHEFACLYLDVSARDDMMEQRIGEALGKVADAAKEDDVSRTEILDEALPVMEEAREYLGVFSDGPAHTIWLKLDSFIARARTPEEER